MRRLFDTLPHPQAWTLYLGLCFIPLTLIWTLLAFDITYMLIDIDRIFDDPRFSPLELSAEELEVPWMFYAMMGHPWIALLFGTISGVTLGLLKRRYSARSFMLFAEGIERSLKKERCRIVALPDRSLWRDTLPIFLCIIGLVALCLAFKLSLTILMYAMVAGLALFDYPARRDTWDWVIERAEKGYIKGVSNSDVIRVKRRWQFLTAFFFLLAIGTTIFSVVMGIGLVGETIEMLAEDAADNILTIHVSR